MNDNVCLECNQTFESAEFVRRHLKKHGMTCEDYTLKHVHASVRPKCACGCGDEPGWNVALKRYATFVHGHHSVGHAVTAETRAKIGAANSVRMREYTLAHPDEAQRHVDAMNAKHTSETERRRIDAMRKKYASMTSTEKQKFSDRMRRRWSDGEMVDAKSKAVATFKRRAASGEITFTERNAKISETVANAYVDGTFAWCRGQHDSPKTGLKHRYRSSWELQYMQLLDADPDVTQWRSEPMSISYVLGDHQRRYVPDFIVQCADMIELVEVKPQSLRDTAMNAAKRAAAIAFCTANGWDYVEWSPV